MLEHGGRSQLYRSLRCRALALGLLAAVGWSSVEVLWEKHEPASTTTLAATAPGDPTSPEDDCPCFCACACQAVHVVLPGSREPGPDRVTFTFDPISVAVAQQDRPADPPYRPPRPPA